MRDSLLQTFCSTNISANVLYAHATCKLKRETFAQYFSKYFSYTCNRDLTYRIRGGPGEALSRLMEGMPSNQVAIIIIIRSTVDTAVSSSQ